MSKLKLGFISLFLGVSLLGTNILHIAAVGNSSAGSFFGLFGAAMLILMAVWDFIDHAAEVSTKAELFDESSKR
jgi:hypothetical protein